MSLSKLRVLRGSTGRTLSSFALLVLALLFSRCAVPSETGSFPRLTEDSREVTLAELSRYYQIQTNGLIQPTFNYNEIIQQSLTFVWDPYFKKRILSQSNIRTEVVQDFFALDLEKFVHESGERDFLTAAQRFYERQLYDSKSQRHERPYRYLNCWGSLFHPPIKRLEYPLTLYHARFTPEFDPKTVTSAYFDPEFQKRLDAETQTELTYGNELDALFNGVESYPAKLSLVDSTKKFLYVAVMTIVADETGRELIRRMVNLKRRGADVRLITEALYAFSISNYGVGVLEREGIPVVRVNDKSLKHLDRVFHNKIWIRDGEEAILGGMNILDYENEANGYNFLNRDTDIRVSGPAVTDLLRRYIELWNQYDDNNRPIALGESTLVRRRAEELQRGVRGSENYARWLAAPGTRMNGICRVAVQGNNAQPQNIATLLLRYLEAAKSSLYMTSPEIAFDLKGTSPTHNDLLARQLLAKASIDSFYVAYITNGADGGMGESSAFIRSRVKDAQRIGEILWEDMLTPIADEEGREVARHVRLAIQPLVRAGVHGFQHFNYVHAKEFYFDRTLVGIGSWNFDIHSAENNHESVIFCLDEKLRLQVERQMALDMINSVPIVFGEAGE